jgi:hypothetical protein
MVPNANAMTSLVLIARASWLRSTLLLIQSASLYKNKMNMKNNNKNRARKEQFTFAPNSFHNDKNIIVGYGQISN